ncbi:HNH endonuclease [Acinetobacter johnsonii]|jgi:5-methylcytosine-specific restriction protein A|nr:HNH endonuclease [Acinetobacter johnsonii]
MGNKSAAMPWLDEELKACVMAYYEMFKLFQEGKALNKTEFRNRILNNELKDRSSGSYEMRMGNISAVMKLLGKPILPGYSPMKNVGGNVTTRLIGIISDVWGTDRQDAVLPVDDYDILNERVNHIRRNKVVIKPQKNGIPKIVTVPVSRYVRDPKVIAWVLDRAQGKCEACGEPAPFITDKKFPFLEVHHILPLSKGGTDDIENVAAVCPNCHRRLHYSNDRKIYREKLITSVLGLKKNYSEAE